MSDDGPIAALGRGEGATIVAEGGSMFPTVRNGDRVRLEPLGTGPVPLGAVVLCVVEGHWVLHRVVRQDGNMLILRGDNQEHDDPPIRRNAVLGTAVDIVGAPWRRPLLQPAFATRVWSHVTPWLARATRAALRARRR